jgi:APA family basic amino acid/polyamine antiporter
VGFDEVVTLSEETRDAARVIPRALLASLAIATALYVVVALASVSVVEPGALAASERPLALVMEHDFGGRAADLVAAIAVAATTNTTLMALTAASRNTFAMARSGSLPRWLSAVSKRTHAPYTAAFTGLVVASAFALVEDIAFVASVTNVAVYVIFVVVNLSVIMLRRLHPDAQRPFRTPGAIGNVPLIPIAAIATVVLMFGSIDAGAWIVGTAVLALGMVVWAIRRRAREGA